MVVLGFGNPNKAHQQAPGTPCLRHTPLAPFLPILGALSSKGRGKLEATTWATTSEQARNKLAIASSLEGAGAFDPALSPPF